MDKSSKFDYRGKCVIPILSGLYPRIDQNGIGRPDLIGI